ncbi:hypothetical protein EV702DRAFT_1046037 [Suillus placidus]|uniref:F-box domain-containing protein n=1 Tax=Suillus placidus TaxID=48579 RepID=A0A9P7D255_9AGAM|nr:hypothetical protein EV702DRAFT_1046037 [Suillus placidus]
MHQALLVPEVILEIFGHVNSQIFPLSPSGKILLAQKLVAQKSMAALAMTCKTFHEPTMDFLWAVIYRLEPLLGCVTRLHPVIYSIGRKYPSGWSSRGVKPLYEDEVDQFLHHALSWEAWRHLSNLSTLLNVVVYEMHSATLSTWSLELDIVNLSPFLNVKSLSLLLNGGCIIAIMKHSVFPSLETFSGNLGVMSSAEAEQLLCALSQCKACQTLERITIRLSCRGPQDFPGSSLRPITQLLCFAQLRTLRLHFPDSSIYVNDDLLLKAASSWPHIRTLQIEGPYHHAATITFCGLFAALCQCPHLHMLQFLIGAVNTDINLDAKPLHSLQILDLTITSHIADAKAVAHIIFSMLPCVDRVSKSMQVWHEVNTYVTHFKASALLAISPGVEGERGVQDDEELDDGVGEG